MTPRWIGTVILTLAVAPCQASGQQEGDIRFGPRERTGRIASEQLVESSGLARSLVHPGKYWTHNDNGSHAGLYLIDPAGRHLATLQLPEAEYRDWESLSGVRIDGQSWLVLADVGDNLARYSCGRLYVFREPDFRLPGLPAGEPVQLEVSDFATIEFTYPEGPRDCEAMTVDAAGERIYLVSKRIANNEKAGPTTLHWLPFRTTSTDRPISATRLKSEFQEPMVTGMDIGPNDQLAVIRTYVTAWIYQRRGRSWSETLAGEPVTRTLLPLQRQGEAICFTHDASGLIITSEGSRQSIWKIGLSIPANDR